MVFPDAIARFVHPGDFRRDETGRSSAQVLLADRYVLKIRPENDRDTRDRWILERFAGMLPLPRVVSHAVENGLDYLLMTRIPGIMLCDPAVMAKPSLLIDCMAEALNRLWALPVSLLPDSPTLTDKLDRAEEKVQAGLFDREDCEPETFGPGGFASPEALLEWLRTNRPEQDPVLSHGDFCLPNLFTDGTGLTGLIDCGNFAVADRWQDIALGWRSLKHNSDGRYGSYPEVHPDDLFRALGMPADREKLRYYILLDEF